MSILNLLNVPLNELRALADRYETDYNTLKEEEQKDVDRLLALMKIQVPHWYNKTSLFENMVTVGVDDREEYNELVEWYKEIKRSISLWKKHGI